MVVIDAQIEYRVWFKTSKGALRCIAINAKSLGVAQEYIKLHKKDIETAVGARIRNPILICLEGNNV